MAYPYTNNGISESKKDFTSGRILFIEDPTAFTPREFLTYMNEGFVPVLVEQSSGNVSYTFAEWSASEGAYGLNGATSTDMDAPFEAQGETEG